MRKRILLIKAEALVKGSEGKPAKCKGRDAEDAIRAAEQALDEGIRKS